MPPTIDDITAQIQGAIEHHAQCAEALWAALCELHQASEPVALSRPDLENEPRGPSTSVVSPSSTHLTPGEPVIYARVNRPRKAKAGPKPAKLPRGERKKRTKITPEMVDDIRARAKAGQLHKFIADALGLSVGAVAARLRKG